MKTMNIALSLALLSIGCILALSQTIPTPTTQIKVLSAQRCETFKSNNLTSADKSNQPIRPESKEEVLLIIKLENGTNYTQIDIHKTYVKAGDVSYPVKLVIFTGDPFEKNKKNSFSASLLIAVPRSERSFTLYAERHASVSPAVGFFPAELVAEEEIHDKCSINNMTALLAR